VFKVNDRDILFRGKRLDRLNIPLRDTSQDGRRRNAHAEMFHQQRDQMATRLNLRHVPVKVQAVDTFNLKSHMIPQKFGYRFHRHNHREDKLRIQHSSV